MITVNGKNIDWNEGMNIEDVFLAMGYNYSLITVTVNGKLIHSDDYDSCKVPDMALVKVLHLCHGG